jgi:hypothetical protein
MGIKNQVVLLHFVAEHAGASALAEAARQGYLAGTC